MQKKHRLIGFHIRLRWRRGLALLLALVMFCTLPPLNAFAVSRSSDEYLCGHLHDENCGYHVAADGMPDTHVHSEDCYVQVQRCTHVCEHLCSHICGDECCVQVLECLHSCGEECAEGCVHEHDESCYATERQCAHVCDETCGGLCTHICDESCFVTELNCSQGETGEDAPVEQPCSHVCKILSFEGNTPGEAVGTYEAADGATYDEICAALPKTLTGTLECTGEAVAIPVHWSCPDFTGAAGDYLFQSELDNSHCVYSAGDDTQAEGQLPFFRVKVTAPRSVDLPSYESYTIQDKEFGVAVTGPMPEGAKLQVRDLTEEELAAYVDEGVGVVFAYDIKILVPGESGDVEYQPTAESPVSVVITPPDVPVEQQVEVTHVSVDETTQEAVVTKVEATALDDGAVEFLAESFSYYIGTVITPGSEVLLSAGAGYDFYSDPECTKTMESGKQLEILKETTIYLKVKDGYQIDNVTITGINGSDSAGSVVKGESTDAFTYKLVFPASASGNQLITVDVIQNLWYNGTGFYTDSSCIDPPISTGSLSELIQKADCRLVIYMKAAHEVPAGDEVVDGGKYSVWVRRENGYTGALVTVPAGNTLILANVTLDGGAVWTGTEDGTLKRGTTNGGLTAAAPLIQVEGSLILQEGAVLQNNDNRNALNANGGAIYLGAGAFMEMDGGSLHNNTAYTSAGNSNVNCCGGAIYSVAKGDGSTAGFVMNSGSISGNDTQFNSIYGGGSVLLDGATMELNGGKITNNKSEWSSGGGISLIRGSDLKMTGGTVDGNSAGGAGGGIYTLSAEGQCTVSISGGTISNNYAGDHGGGGVYLSQGGAGACTITGGKICRNTTTGPGGAVYLGNNRVTMSGGQVTADNKAASDASDGFYIYTNGKLILSGGATISAPIYCDYSGDHLFVSGPLTGHISVKPLAYADKTVFALGATSNEGVPAYSVTAQDAKAFIITGGPSGTTYYAEVLTGENKLAVKTTAGDQSLELTATPTNVGQGGTSTITATVSGGDANQVEWSLYNASSSGTTLSQKTGSSTTLTIGKDETSTSVTVTAILPTDGGTITRMISVTVNTPAAFVVTIPEAVTMGDSGTFSIRAEGSGYSTAPTITVKVDHTGAFQLKNGSGVIPYYLYQDSKKQIAITETYPTVAVFSGKTLFDETKYIYYEVDTSAPQYAGTYTDTITFTVAAT